MSAKKQDIPTGAQLRALRDIKLADQADPAIEARRHEASFLSNMRQAKADFDWIVAHEAWTKLGHATFADWWDARVMPIAAGLGMRPTREIAKVVIEKVVEDQKDLPKAQQRTQRQIAAMVGTNQSTVARSTADANASGADLEDDATDHTDEEHDPGCVPVDAPPAPSGVPGVASDGAPAEQESADSVPAEARRAGTGVAPPVADLVDTPIGPMPREFAEKLDRLVPDPNPHREWRAAFLKDVFAAAKAMRGYSGVDIAEKADDKLRAEFARFVADMEDLLRAVSTAQVAAAGNNVRPLRRVQ